VARPGRRWWLLAGLVVLLWGIAVGVLLVQAALDLREGRTAAQAARDDLDTDAVTSGRPVPALRRAAARFGSARRASGNPVLAPVRFLPVVGRQLRSVHALSGAAHEVADAAAVAVARASAALESPPAGGPARVAQIRELAETLSQARRRVMAVDDLGPRQGLLGPLASARNDFARDLADARDALADAEAGANAGLRLLEGPRRYLLIAANNAEMRGGSGMWLSGGVLTTAAGRLDLGEVAPLADRYNPPEDVRIPIPDPDLAARWGALWQPERDWRGLMASPRLPASATLGLRMWEAAGEEPVDGFFVIDPVGLGAVIAATGPVEVEGERFDQRSVVPYLLHEQYLVLGDDPSGNEERREELGRIAEAAFDALDRGDWSAATLASELGKAIRGRHLLAWSSDPVEQAGWEAAGMSGDLAADSLLVSVLNRGGNKLDQFLEIKAELRTDLRADGDGTDAHVRLSLVNTTPLGLPRYVAGPLPGVWWEYGDYIGLVVFSVPGAATELEVVDGGQPHVFGRDGPTNVVSADLVLPRGARREMLLRFRLPDGVRQLQVEPSARVPPLRWVHGSSRWEDSAPHAANW
jgi:hypothetical protein